MEIVVSQAQGRVPVTVFKLKGDLSGEEPLQSRAEQAHAAGMRDLLLDLSEVPYISSAGLRALHVLYRLLRDGDPAGDDAAERRGIIAGSYSSPHLKLLKPGKHARQALSVAGFDMFLEVYSEFSEALASF
ncbi:MAG: STAS domain-containing protein [Candidatus Promineifilaceae bacterium]